MLHQISHAALRIACLAWLFLLAACPSSRAPAPPPQDPFTSPPRITRQPESMSTFVGESASFFVDANDALSYQWQRNGVNIAGETTATLNLDVTALADDGATFRVIVSNAVGSVTSNTVTLAVLRRTPAITDQPDSMTVQEGEDAGFEVAATGTGALTYQWYRNNNPIPGATAQQFTWLRATLADDGAEFSVDVTDSQGTTRSAAAVLTVRPLTQQQFSLLGFTGPMVMGPPIQFRDMAFPSITPSQVVVRGEPYDTGIAIADGGAWGSPFGPWATTFVRARVVQPGQLTELQPAATTHYANGRLQAVDLGLPGVSTRTWTTLPAELICANPVGSSMQRTAQDFQDPARSWMFFVTPRDPQLSCFEFADLQWLAARVNMDEDTPPLPIGEPLATVYNDQGGIAGHVVRDGFGTVMKQGDTIQYVNANFENPRNLFDFANFQALGVMGDTPPGKLVFTDGSRVMRYNLDGSQAEPEELIPAMPGRTVTSRFLVNANENEGFNAFVILLIGTDELVWRLPGQDAAVLIGQFPAGPLQTEYNVTDSHVIQFTDRTVRSLPKTGGTATTIATIDADVSVMPIQPRTPSFNLNFGNDTRGRFAVAGEYVWYQTARNAAGTKPSRVHSVRGDGTGAQTIDGARIAKVAAPPSLGLFDAPEAHTLYIAESESAAGAFGGATIRAYRGEDRSLQFTLGVLPADAVNVIDVAVPPMQFGMRGLITWSIAGNAWRIGSFKSDEPGLTPVTEQ
jgi:hypothetical protein